MKVLSLFAGIGGFDLAFEKAGHQVVASVEISKYCRAILAHHFPTAKQYSDIRSVTGEQILRDCGAIDIVCGGFPCQDISSAGKGAGLDGERSGLWWEMHRLIGELKPVWVVAENVFAIRSRGLDRVVSSLEEMGYRVECIGLSANTFGFPHERKRVFIVAYAEREGRRAGDRIESDEAGKGIRRNQFEHTDLFRAPAKPGRPQFAWESEREAKSEMGFTVDGIPRKLALRSCGNAVIPGIVFGIAKVLGRMERLMEDE